ncbi:MAG: CpXC domain-containing protein [Endomicrobium sp.]|jgi:hypothetical protein|nr:CpXC domain-containing protein [Endomicrobium sp.]
MTISNLEKIKCPKGHIFEAQLISAISVSDNFELKEALIAGEVNLVTCPDKLSRTSNSIAWLK